MLMVTAAAAIICEKHLGLSVKKNIHESRRKVSPRGNALLSEGKETLDGYGEFLQVIHTQSAFATRLP